ncbi:MAG: dienelactone hydrolase family protein, partial [Chloroflexi bacterium]|nr:dienelactone hydrolase family protein [Chloroflexota bacterium]
PDELLGDFADLLNYVRTHADAFSLDRERVALMGFSALSRHHFSAALSGSPRYVRALVSYYGWLDSGTDALSPLYYLQSQAGPFPPMFIAKAGKDRFGPDINNSIDRFVAAAQAKHLDVQYAAHPDGQHGFDTLKDDISQQIVQQTLAFLQAKLAL